MKNSSRMHLIEYLNRLWKIATAFQISRVKPWIECILDLASKGNAAGSVEFFCAQFAKPNGNYVPFTEDYRGWEDWSDLPNQNF